MSRFDWAENYEDYPNQQALWRANRDRLLRGKRGQLLLKQVEQALLALPEKRLIANQLAAIRCDEITGDAIEITGVCVVGAYALFKGKTAEDLNKGWIESEDTDAWEIAEWADSALGLPNAMAQWLEWANDEEAESLNPIQRYEFVLAKVRAMIHG